MGDIYLDMPINRQHIADRKMAKLQQQISALENRIQENGALRRQLEGINDAEKERSQRVIDKVKNRNMVLTDEIDRIYKHRSPVLSPSPSQLVEEVISRRTKEFSELQQEKALQIKYLMAEKQRLQVAQEKLREKRRSMNRMPTPEGEVSMRQPSAHSVHSTNSLLGRAVHTMPHTVERIWQLKEELRYDYDTKKRPYRGELGVDSYQPWQIEDYVLVRKIVEDIADDFIAKYIPPDYAYVEGDVRWAMQLTQDKEWIQTTEALSERKAVQLVAEEILLQETRSVMRQAAAEVIHVHGTFKNLTDILLMREAERIGTGKEEGREPTDPAYNLITKSYFTQQQNRNKHKRDVWSHSQYLHLPAATRTKGEPLEDIGTDVEMITFHHLHPTDLQKFKAGQFDQPNIKRQKEYALRYRKREAEFWTGMQPGLFTLDLASGCGGVQCMRPSPNHWFMAIGTVHGDILVYDVRVDPWRIARVINNGGPVDDSTIDIGWSLGGTRLVSVNQGGSMIVWSLEGPPIVRKDMRGLSLQADEHGNLPKQLGRLAILDVDNGDFTFKMGPLAESRVQTDKFGPVKGVFFPSFSLFGVQHSVCASLENGDVMKVNLEPLEASSNNMGGEVTYPDAPCIFQPNIYDESHGVNLVGQNLEAELFRQHQAAIVFIGFVDNISRLVTVDEEGYINLWKYDPAFISGFGYFIPEKKYKLDFNKTMYTPSNTEKPNIIFTDTAKSTTKTQADIARERGRVQNQLDKMRLGDPWHEEIVLGKNLVTSVYAPRGGVKDSGAMFNIVMRHEQTQQLSTYLTRMYKPVKIKCTKMLSVCQTPSGRELVFILLFPEYPPKEPHMTVLVLDLVTMKLRPIRRDIHLSVQEHNRLTETDTVSFDVTRTLAPTGAEYLFVMMNGRLRCLSLTTGNLVLRLENPDRPTGFIGCTVDERYVSVPKTAKVTSVCCNGKIYAALHDKASTTVQVIQLKDGNSYEGRRLMWKAYQLWDKFHPVAPETRVDKVTWALSDMQHAEVEMRRLILDLVDEKVFGFQEGADEQADTARAVQDKIDQYNAMQIKVDKAALLEGPNSGVR